MAEVQFLNPHDPAPEGGHAVVVMRRFDDGTPMSLDQAVAAARLVADEAGIETVQVIDRTAGPRERDIQQHGGDHSVHMERLDDDDMEEGERGPDMRDRS